MDSEHRSPEEILADLSDPPDAEVVDDSPQETPSDSPPENQAPPETPKGPPQETPAVTTRETPDEKGRVRSDRDHLRFGPPKDSTATLQANGGEVTVNQSAVARRTFKLDEDLMQGIVTRIKAGAYKTVACRSVGINVKTMRKWENTGKMVFDKLVKDYGEDVALTYDETSDSPWPAEEVHPNLWMCFRLMKSMDKAEAEVEVLMTGYITAAARENWLPAMTFLERKHPDRWKRRDLHEVAAAEKLEAAEEDQLLTPEAQDALDNALAIEAGESSL